MIGDRQGAMWFISSVDKLVIEAGNIFDWSSDKIIWRGAMKRVDVMFLAQWRLLACGSSVAS